MKPPPLPPPEFLDTLPAMVREAFQRPQLEAIFESGDLTIEFHCPDEFEIRFLNADVRGNGDPMPTLERVCVPKG